MEGRRFDFLLTKTFFAGVCGQAGEKSGWELSAGVDINLLFRASGTVYSRFNLPITLHPGQGYYDQMFCRSTGMGVWAAYPYRRKWTERLFWQLSANAQLPLHPVSHPDYELVQRYFYFGVQAGVAYRIGRAE